ncbi:MAG: 16S rRNA (cytidine(1402)-2'-O)-methyltransferase [Pelistega sp.]|nr:16S rRNA (cytidine(1402)-2'-O)-methyltransferase [Pelistega sp.]
MSIAVGQFSHSVEMMVDDLNCQYWPESALYIVATPIGNLSDISVRALYTLQMVDMIACEDTRSSKSLLNSYAIQTPLMAAHQHNEMEAAQQIIQRLSQGQRVALISDAGAPAVSDPGGKIVTQVRQAGFDVRPIPGASAVITALMGSGVTDDSQPGFTFAGFVPPKSHARQQWFEQWKKSPVAVLMFESPHRIVDSLKDLSAIVGAARQITIARELTKRFEQMKSGSVDDVLAWIQEDDNRQRGEFVLILSPEQGLEERDEKLVYLDTLLEVMLVQVSLKDAVKMATKLTSLSKDVVYSRALVLKDNLAD